jgi:hypothetical protein
MLRFVIEKTENFNEETQEFLDPLPEVVVELEHSLLSLSKWESKYQKPFLSAGEKTATETFDYLKMMVLPPTDPEVLRRCNQRQINEVQTYIESSQSATIFGEMPERRGKGEVITSELIYYWMVAFNVPFDCETWHLNRLFSLIRICNLKNSKPKKMSRNELARRNAELNEKRKQQLGTRG